MVYKFPVKQDSLFTVQLQICVMLLHNPNPKQLKQIIVWIFGHYSDTQGNSEVFLSSLENLLQILTAAAVIWNWAAIDKY